MTHASRIILGALLAAGIHGPAAAQADVKATTVETGVPSMRGASNTSIAVGRGTLDPASRISITPRVFIQPLPPERTRQDSLTTEDRRALKREFTFVDETNEAALLDVVAAIRSGDRDEADGEAGNGAAVNEWTTALDSEEEPALAPPPARQKPAPRAEQPAGGLQALP